MNPKVTIIMAFIALSIAGIWYDDFRPTSHFAEMRMQPMQDVTLYKLEGNESLPLSAYKGKTILLNVWASWCPPCREEFPLLIEWAKENPDTLVVIALSADDTREPAKRFLKQINAPSLPNFITAWDKDKSISQDVLGTIRFPESYVISPDFVLQDKITGMLTDEDKSRILYYSPRGVTDGK